MDLTGFIGGAATCASVTSFLPQAVKVVKTKDASAISAKMYGVTVVGFALWTAYGAMIASYPLIATNSLCFLFSAFILAMKLLPQERKEAVAERIDPAA
jgi:MtN3 and saliva related transmembrane protein